MPAPIRDSDESASRRPFKDSFRTLARFVRERRLDRRTWLSKFIEQTEDVLAADEGGLGRMAERAGMWVHVCANQWRDVAAFLRQHSPAAVDQERLHGCLDAVESPWPRRGENMLRLARERQFDTNFERARHLVEEVERIGAEPFHAPEPLPPIEAEEIHLITWMAIEREVCEVLADKQR